MKLLVLLLVFLSSLQFCSIPKEGYSNEKIRINMLLQDKRGWPQYIFLKKDTAFYQRRQFDKPSYFTDLDTLIRISTSNKYESKNSFFYFDTNNTAISYFNRQDTTKIKYFVAATLKQKGEWDSFTNIDKYRKMAKDMGLYNNSLYPLSRFNNLNTDTDQLMKLASILTQKEYDSALNVFKEKYTIR